ncbi:MAG: glycosyltransferase family 2 protein [Bdellovibrionota bacterium]
MGIDVKPVYSEYQKRKNYNIGNFTPVPEKLSVILITKNEEKNIVRCLESVAFANEVILVDTESTDKTCDLARQFKNVKIVQAQWFGFVENKKIALQHTSNEWVFWIDADEVAPENLQQEWEKVIASAFFHEIGAIDLPRKTFFLGHWVKHSGWYPNRTVRFFHKSRAGFSENILHESICVKEGYKVAHFKTDLLHYSYTSLYQYFDKMNRYGMAGAQEIARKKKMFFLPQLFFQPLWTFIRFYFLKKGFLDGRIGIIVCVGAAFSNFIKYANYLFIKKYGYIEK